MTARTDHEPSLADQGRRSRSVVAVAAAAAAMALVGCRGADRSAASRPTAVARGSVAGLATAMPSEPRSSPVVGLQASPQVESVTSAVPPTDVDSPTASADVTAGDDLVILHTNDNWGEARTCG